MFTVSGDTSCFVIRDMARKTLTQPSGRRAFNGCDRRRQRRVHPMTERIAFLPTLEIDPKSQARISYGQWDKMIREGNAMPAWLANG